MGVIGREGDEWFWDLIEAGLWVKMEALDVGEHAEVSSLSFSDCHEGYLDASTSFLSLRGGRILAAEVVVVAAFRASRKRL